MGIIKSFLFYFISFLFLFLSSSNAQNDTSSTWISQPSGVGAEFYSIHFANPNTGWAVGSGGAIVKTNKGGEIWERQSSNTAEDLQAVFAISESIAFSVGSHGIILKTTDGGRIWNKQNHSTSEDFRSVFFITPKIGWIVGVLQGTILKTTNGGVTWIQQNSGATQGLLCVNFFNSDLGWAVGHSGKILKTINGGSIWQTKNSGIVSALLSVYFYSSKIGWAVGFTGKILKTTNGGESWVNQPSGTNVNLRSVYFNSENEGWAVGFSGLILRTIDGGQNWISQPSGTNVDLYTIYCTSSLTAWSAGSNGKILKTNYDPHDLFLSSPSGGEEWFALSTRDIEWMNGGNVNTIKIEYSTNEGQDWAIIATNIAAITGHYFWTLPNIATDSCKIKISCVENSKFFDISERNIKISKQAIVWGAQLTISDPIGSGQQESLIFGLARGATDSIDVAIGELDLPPAPPAGVFDVRFDIPTYLPTSSLKDYRIDGQSKVTWILSFQFSSPGLPIQLKWVPSLLPRGSFYLKDLVNGAVVNTDMKRDSSLIISNFNISKLKIEYIDSSTTGVKLKLLSSAGLFDLAQNFPNPFNPSTTIRFSLPEKAQVSIIVYNQLGQKVTELLRAEKESGNYQVEWNASNLPSGVYIYEMRTDKFSSIKKLILMK